MAWHATCSRPPLPSDSYVRWREALVALLRTIDLGLGLAGRMHGRTLAALPQPGSAGGVLGLCVSLPRLLYASASIAFPLMLMAWPVRLRCGGPLGALLGLQVAGRWLARLALHFCCSCRASSTARRRLLPSHASCAGAHSPLPLPPAARRSLSCFAQAVAVLSLRRSFRGMCEGHLAHPSVQRDIHTTAQLLRMATLLPPQQVPPADPVAECDTVLSWLLVCLGLLAPLLLQAAAAGRTFHRHQQQRSEQGLPLERGRQARVYSALRSCLGGAEGYAAPAMGGALFALCAFAWDLCALHCQRTLHSSLLPEA